MGEGTAVCMLPGVEPWEHLIGRSPQCGLGKDLAETLGSTRDELPAVLAEGTPSESREDDSPSRKTEEPLSSATTEELSLAGTRRGLTLCRSRERLPSPAQLASSVVASGTAAATPKGGASALEMQPGENSATPSQQEASRQEVPEEAKGPKKKGGAVLFNASHSDYEVVAAAAEARGWKVVKSEERGAQCHVHWIDDSAIGDWLRRVEPWMRVNHFPGMNNALARKTRLARNMSRMQRIFPKEYQFLPPTWVLPDDLGDLEKQFGDGTESKVIYIAKPDHLCQGKGIFLTMDLDRLRKCATECRDKDQSAVVQRYISRPMLIDGFKFDLRLYFLVCGKPPEGGSLDLRMFLFRDGLVRLCTTQYAPPTAETMNHRCMHLTNYAVNKNSANFQQTEDAESGSKRSLSWFLSHVEEEHGEKERRKLWLKLMGLCVKTVLTVQPTLEAEYTGTFPRDLAGGQMGCRCFEILGIDVMLDQRRKPYLIEINHLPSFTCDAPLDEDIKRRLVDQTMDITCGTLSAKDKRTYEQLVRERREGSAASGAGEQPGSAAGASSNACLMDMPSYKDFERAFPPPEGATKLAEHCEAILNRVRGIFKPVHAVRNRSASRDVDPQPPQRPPPLPPKIPSSAAVRAVPAVKRSRSAPGPPRCALPPIPRSNLASPRRGGSQSPGPGDSESDSPSSASKRPQARSLSRPPRAALPLKSATILL
mmetsp:Transcript_107783/g.300433  ORF Transcript_107783/g.300433 Transcript_107783/m.300433 type:complete len:709 (+) Transcript_107783:151-2277(+)